MHGDVRRINVEALDHRMVHDMVYDIMNDSQRKIYEEHLEVDFSFEIQGLARFRVNAFNQNAARAPCSGRFRARSLAGTAQRPKVFAELALKPRGMVLVTRAHRLGQEHDAGRHGQPPQRERVRPHPDHRGPDQFVHESKKCLINQREVGPHTLSFSNALRSALREDQDAVLVGEMRDLETIRLALTAAKPATWSLAPCTSSAAKTVDRIVDVFPGQPRRKWSARCCPSPLVAVISQTLLKAQGRHRPRGGARDHAGQLGHPEPDPREQGGPDVLRHPDRQFVGACRPWTRI